MQRPRQWWISREKMYKRKENTLQNFSGSSVHPSQGIFCNGIILCGPQGQSTSQASFKVKLGSKVCNFFLGGEHHNHQFYDLFALKQCYWNTSPCPCRQLRLRSVMSSEKPDKKRQFVHSAWLRNENELIWRVTASCLWNVVFEEPTTGKSRLNWAQVKFSVFFTATGRKPPC